MDVTWLYIIVGSVLLLQIGLFIAGRKLRKKQRENDILLKYDIKSRHDAWKVIADPETPEEDREKIEKLYNS